MKWPREHFERLQIGLLNLLDSLGSNLAHHESKEAREFIDAGEYGLAFETICVCLTEKSIIISRGDFIDIERLGRAMELPETTWNRLSVHHYDEEIS
ncbi:MAG: MafI family immunity protein [Verrucomicrobia bacterium]|nr:MafI family immunity protein [Verrucomicrobiota bacterium]